METAQENYLKPVHYSIGSVYKQLVHTLSLERWWIGFLATGESNLLSQEDQVTYEDRTKLRQLWDETNAFTLDYIQTLSDEDLQRKVSAPWWDEQSEAITVAQALTHVINHSTDHRAQTMGTLHILGYEGIEQDFMAYLGHT